MPSVLAARQIATVMTNTIGDTLGIEHEPPWKVGLERQNQRQPGEVTE